MVTRTLDTALKSKLAEAAELARKAAQLEKECLACLSAYGLANDELELVSSDHIKLAHLKDYWADTLTGLGGQVEKLVNLLEQLPRAEAEGHA